MYEQCREMEIHGTFVHVFCVGVKQDKTHALQLNSIQVVEYFCFTEQERSDFIKQIKYPYIVVEDSKRVALRVGDVYHPLGAPFVKAPGSIS